MTVKQPDIFRDTYIRYLGYTNEIGESFKAFLPRWAYLGTYAVACTYVAADAFDKGAVAYKISDDPNKHARAAVAVVDTGLWQSFASVIIPGVFINRLCAASMFTVTRLAPKLKGSTHKWITTAVGLLSIPMIIQPIDHLVEESMNNLVRPRFVNMLRVR
ncbi:hypothetical protein SARC_01961 [Sphaeroforma arctica JP610]|uniref:Mitochondrial fission process protein 1 n=1 Tax=Sphaeroforma arctica JP610 TaxID=667725 RepID=A0A0L0GA59_9EUKA|nr:hypothetical protein SARC_01961 [Sphaeroforma arctica JP610]KNC85885.1 hypothetical protein SARC_01961 [Sphaeroforma arctica JP610]|eukprot:XP_014159787.1 hypothetical protein SARC_01961 [Sphaeroforma arctica JP610]